MKTKTTFSKFKNVPGTKGKVKTATVQFTYTPPTETESKIYKVEKALKVYKSLQLYLAGLKASGSLEPLPYDSCHVIKETIEVNEQRLRELKRLDSEEKSNNQKKK